MERLIKLSEKRLKSIDTGFHRYLYQQVQWDKPLSIIKGARGTGKTTLLLQHMKLTKQPAIYLSLDDFYFESNRLTLLAENLYEKGYRHFFLDEVHQYPYWSKDLKNLYDSYPDIRMVATGSSVLQIDKGQADLSRRANLYSLNGLSFREFLDMEYNLKNNPLELSSILENHMDISPSINDRLDVLKAFSEYLNFGYLPFFKPDKTFYHQKLQQIIHLIIEIDITAVEKINYTTVRSMKNLLFIISQSVPFTPNIQNLSDKTGVPRNTVLKALDLLEKSGVLNLLRSNNKGISFLQKPDKIYLENPNIAYTFSGSKPNKGNLRETFFLNQLKVNHDVTSSKYGDFMVNNAYTFEIGGAVKTTKQIKGIPQAFIAADEIENGVNNKIPLWLFGFLY